MHKERLEREVDRPAVIAVVAHEVNSREVQRASTDGASRRMEHLGMIGIRELCNLLELGLRLSAIRCNKLAVLPKHITQARNGTGNH